MLYSVYCSGSIVKGSTDEKKLRWTDTEKSHVRQGASPDTVVFLNPDDPICDPGNTLGQFGRDMFQIKVATVVIVDARERRGLGIGVEMAAAATLGTPVIVVAPRNSKYRTDELAYRGAVVQDYIHPHVASLAAVVVDDFASAGEALRKVAAAKVELPNVPGWLSVAVAEYRNNMLLGDPPMLDAMAQLGLSPED